MKKFVLFLLIGMLLFSGALFAQTAQGANARGGAQPQQQQQQRQQPAASSQEVNPDYFAGGGYTGPVLAPITIADLAEAEPNQFVIVEGFVVLQRVPGTYILADAAQDATASVVIRLNPYFWSNLDIGADTPVLVYGIVNRSELRIEIEATRIEIK